MLRDLKRVTKRKLFFNIATRPAQKTLPDGRNAHLIVETAEWWLNQLWERFKVVGFQDFKGVEMVAIVEKK